MTYAWFRMYSEALDDEKLRLLAFEDRWHFVALLCCKSQGLLDTSDDPALRQRKIAVKLGLQTRELEEVARRLSEVGLIDKDTLQPLAWDKRQYISDRSTDRVARHRERKKQAGNDMKQACNVSVTPPDTDTDTDTDIKKDKPSSSPALRVPVEEIVDLYHQYLPMLPKVAIISQQRERHIKARWKDNIETLDGWKGYFMAVARSRFLTGQVPPTQDRRKPWKADLDWLIKEQNIVKVYEGKYSG